MTDKNLTDASERPLDCVVRLRTFEGSDALGDGDFSLLTEAAGEIERLRAAIATAYGYLWCVNCEPGTPRQYSPERAAIEARKALRDLLTTEQRGEAINRVVSLVHEAGRNDGLQMPNVELTGEPRSGESRERSERG